MRSLERKIIVVTGGSGLIGKEIVKFLRSYQAIVINAEISINEDNFENGEIHCDITSSDSIKSVINKIIKEYGRIDGWVNNAYPRTKDWGNHFESIQEESWSKNVDYQLNSIFKSCQLVLKVMKRQKSGSVVNISSIYGSVGPDFGVYDGTEMTMPAAYSAIKGGVVNFSRYLASYYGPSGVRINCVSPGGVFDNQNELFVNQYAERTPMKRMGNPDEIAPAVAFLLSNESSYITGHNLVVDGGWTAK